MTIEALARKMMLTAIQAVALPAVLDAAARSLGMTRDAMVSECFANARMAEYLALLCRRVTA